MPDYLCTELTTISIVKFNILCNYLSFEKHMQMYYRLHEYTSIFICFTTCFREKMKLFCRFNTFLLILSIV